MEGIGARGGTLAGDHRATVIVAIHRHQFVVVGLAVLHRFVQVFTGGRHFLVQQLPRAVGGFGAIENHLLIAPFDIKADLHAVNISGGFHKVGRQDAVIFGVEVIFLLL